MLRVLYGLVSVVLALFVSVTVTGLFMPDPTGIKPTIVGFLLTPFLSAWIYRHFRGRRSS